MYKIAVIIIIIIIISNSSILFAQITHEKKTVMKAIRAGPYRY